MKEARRGEASGRGLRQRTRKQEKDERAQDRRGEPQMCWPASFPGLRNALSGRQADLEAPRRAVSSVTIILSPRHTAAAFMPRLLSSSSPSLSPGFNPHSPGDGSAQSYLKPHRGACGFSFSNNLPTSNKGSHACSLLDKANSRCPSLVPPS